MSTRSQIHDWCTHFLPYFGGWCALLTLVVTIFIAIPNRSTAGTIIFIVGSSVGSLIWFIAAVVLIAAKRRQEQKDQEIESLEFIDRKRIEPEDRAGQNAASGAILSVAKIGFAFEGAKVFADLRWKSLQTLEVIIPDFRLKVRILYCKVK